MVDGRPVQVLGRARRTEWSALLGQVLKADVEPDAPAVRATRGSYAPANVAAYVAVVEGVFGEDGLVGDVGVIEDDGRVVGGVGDGRDASYQEG